MRSPLAERVATELPQIVYVPPDIASQATARDTIELAARYQICDGAPLSPSQELRLLNGMALRADGSWAAKRVGDYGGRQGAGKSATVIARIFGGIFLVGETLTIYTAHEYPTANEIYLRIGAILESWDDLSRLVIHERKAHGDQGFELKGPPGSEITGKRRLLFKTRTGKSGRGFAKADLIIYDEAQHVQREHVAGSGPAKLANPRSQSWWSGSGGLVASAPAWEMRLQAVTGVGAGRLSYTEHTAETWEVTSGGVEWFQPDPDDRDGWYRANCGLGLWVAEEDMADLKLELGPLFARECLCIWEPLPSTDGPGPKLDVKRWEASVTRRPPEVKSGDCTLAFDIHHGWCSIVISSGSLASSYGEVVEHHKGDGWLPARLAELVEKWKPTAVGLDGGNGEAVAALGVVREYFESVGLDPELVKPLTQAQYKAACGDAYAAIENGAAKRPDRSTLDSPHDQLASAGEVAAERRIGESFVWCRKSATVPLSPLIAWTIGRSLLSAKPAPEFFYY